MHIIYTANEHLHVLSCAKQVLPQILTWHLFYQQHKRLSVLNYPQPFPNSPCGPNPDKTQRLWTKSSISQDGQNSLSVNENIADQNKRKSMSKVNDDHASYFLFGIIHKTCPCTSLCIVSVMLLKCTRYYDLCTLHNNTIRQEK